MSNHLLHLAPYNDVTGRILKIFMRKNLSTLHNRMVKEFQVV